MSWKCEHCKKEFEHKQDAWRHGGACGISFKVVEIKEKIKGKSSK